MTFDDLDRDPEVYSHQCVNCGRQCTADELDAHCGVVYDPRCRGALGGLFRQASDIYEAPVCKVCAQRPPYKPLSLRDGALRPLSARNITFDEAVSLLLEICRGHYYVARYRVVHLRHRLATAFEGRYWW